MPQWALNNLVFLRGNVTSDIYYNPDAHYLRIYLAVEHSKGTNYFRVVAYGNLADWLYPQVQAGTELAVTGQLQQRRVEDKIVTEVAVRYAAPLRLADSIPEEGGG